MISYMSAQREHIKCASGSVVEHHLAKVGAAGSSPVSRSIRIRFRFQAKSLNLNFFFVIKCRCYKNDINIT